ncbi:MAG: putative methyltransferase [Proteobacteria bacterium]|nr:putative methyltransferase [Pseudomonadota bacterium]
MYRWNPEDYARHSSGQEKWAQELIGLLELQPDDTVLDIGCGDGRHTAHIADQLVSGHAVGVDCSADMIRHAHHQHVPGRQGRLCFAVENAASLPFQEEFSLVFSNAALHWVKDHRPVLAGIARALKPGGRAVLQMGGYGNAAEIIAAFDRVRARPEWQNFFVNFELSYGFHRPEDYRPWCAEAGLEAPELCLLPKEMRYADREGLLGWIRTVWQPYTECVPEARREAFIHGAVDEYLLRYPADKDGQTSVRMVRLQARLQKPFRERSQ